LAPTDLFYQDWAALSRQFPNQDRLKWILENFIKHHADSGHCIRALLIEQNVAGFSQLVHNLRGAATLMHAPAIVAETACIELRTRDECRIDPVTANNLAFCMDQWISEIADKLSSLSTS
jgi:HPt (histidine-containing phosphotransfer) domain-containing protein